MPIFKLLLGALMCAGLETGIVVSPDQPLPYSYIDDPLVLELHSSSDIRASLGLHVEGAPWPQPLDFNADPIQLRAGVPGLTAFNGLPPQRGLFAGGVKIATGAEETTIPITFARIERPALQGALPVFIHTVERVEHVQAARAAGAQAIRVDLSQPDPIALIRAAAPTPVALDPGTLSPDALVPVIAALPADLAGQVIWWVVDPKGDLATLQAFADKIHEAPCKAPIAMIAPDATTFERLMNEGAGRLARAAVLASDVTTGKEARLLLDAAERAGFESWPLFVQAAGAGGANAPSHAVQQVFANLAVGAMATGIPANLLFSESRMGEAFVVLCGLQHRLGPAQHAGVLPFGSAITAHLFRDGASWIAVLWSEGAAKEVKIGVGSAQQLQLRDAFGNPVELPAAKEGLFTLSIGPMPIMLSGTGGSLLAEAARNKAQLTARRLLDDKGVQRWLSPELRALVQAVLDRKGELDRSSILALQRTLPELERLWHDGKLPRTVAVPAIADIARLCRLLSTVDQDSGQPYLEPMQDMIARSEEQQSIYLTGSSAAAAEHARGDWILDEVRNLIDDARRLAAADRGIEAAGVAALAESRARALEFAAKEGEKSRLGEAEILAAMQPGTAPPPPAPATDSTVTPEEPAAAATAKADVPKADVKLEPGQPKGTRKVVHTVKSGETPASIAKKYGVDLEAFRKANGLRRDAKLRAGRQYTVYVPAANVETKETQTESPAKAETKLKEKPEENKATEKPVAGQPAGTRKVTHKVAKGDNPSVIAKKYGVKTEDFLKWNKLTPKARFQIGEEYVVYVPAKR